MRWMCLAAVLLLVVGCTNLEDMNSRKQDDSATAGSAAAAPGEGDNPQAAAGADAAPAGGAAKPAGPPDANSIPAIEAKVVDLKKAQAENPKLVVIDNKIKGGDPFSAAASAYVSLHAKAQLLAFQHSLKTARAVEGRNPTYDEFIKLVQQHKVDFNRLKPYHFYGYDEESGDLVVLEDKGLKIQIFKEKGIPLEPGDEQYE